MSDLTPDHPAVEAGAREVYVHDAPSHDPQTWPPSPDALADDYRGVALAALSAALLHLTADDLPTRLVRDIQTRTIRATARAATYEEDGIPWDQGGDRATVAAWLDGLADNIEEEADHA